MESKEFERLVKLALSGNEDAFTDLFNETERMVYSMCKNILRNNEDAEDAMQETFVKAFKTLKDLKEPARFPGWLKTIATTTALDMYKKRRERHSDLNVDIAIEAGDLSEADDNLENLPEDYIMNEENRKDHKANRRRSSERCPVPDRLALLLPKLHDPGNRGNHGCPRRHGQVATQVRTRKD